MGKRAKYTDDLLLEAVVKYSEFEKGTIKATELARWARNNVVGLEEVKDYHFTRKVKNPKTGKYEKKLCTHRIEELNVARSIPAREKVNVLISSVNMDRFFELDEYNQRITIREMREIVSKYKRTNNNLKKQNDYLKATISEINEKMSLYEDDIKDIKKKQKILDKMVSVYRRNIQDEQIRNKLEEMGITDGDFDLVKYNNSLREGINEIFNIEEAIKHYQKMINLDENDEEEEHVSNSIKDDLIGELLDF